MNVMSANQVVEWCGALQRDGDGRATVIHVPARQQDNKPRIAQVALSYTKDKINVVCRTVEVNGDESTCRVCQAEQGERLCYHGIAAIIFRANEAGRRTFFYTLEEEDKARSNSERYKGTMLSIVCCDKVQGFVSLSQAKNQTAHVAAPVPAKPAPAPQTANPLEKLIAEMMDKLGLFGQQMEAMQAKVERINDKVFPPAPTIEPPAPIKADPPKSKRGSTRKTA